MIGRRQLLKTGVVGGLLGEPSYAAPAAAAREGQLSDRNTMDLVQALNSIKTEIANVKTEVARPQTFEELATLRDQQRRYLAAQGKFPDFIEVGMDVWFSVYDWHIKHLQPMTLGRDSLGRYTIVLMFTTLILRFDMVPTYIGMAYDNR